MPCSFLRFKRQVIHVVIAAVFIALSAPIYGADRSLKDNPELAQYFEQRVAELEQRNALQNYKTLEEWTVAREGLRQQLFGMLGMEIMPQHTDLKTTVTGIVYEQDFRVEKIHFQSMPGLYVTANLYLPIEVNKPLPVVLYVCGHARVKEGDVSFGNKVGYQHHGAWYARNGYACLTIDTLQLGEIEGVHHGTYRHNRWWWNSHGYSPAGVEAWNCIRALDYLETRPEVDTEQMGVTGRSGGGAYSWWIAALDDRIKCAVPVAGITTLRNHIVDGCVEGHCDCMFMTNRHRWDYATVAALVAPRPLLISNSDKDSIFPLDGVVGIHRQVRHIYELYDKPDHLGLQITEGPHKDTQELRIHAFRWMNRWLKNDDSLIEKTATKFFEPKQLQVFTALPNDERNTRIDEEFVKLAETPDVAARQRILANQKLWQEESLRKLRATCFAAWPTDSASTDLRSMKGELSEAIDLGADAKIRGTRLHFHSENHVPLFVDVFQSQTDDAAASDAKTIRLLLPAHEDWEKYSTESRLDTSSSLFAEVRSAVLQEASAVAVFFSRGSGPHAWVGDERKQTQIRRRFQLLGTTLDAMRVWDIRSAISVVQNKMPPKTPVTISASMSESWLGLLAMITVPSVDAGRFSTLSADNDHMAILPDIARIFTPEEIIAIANLQGNLVLISPQPNIHDLTQQLSNNLLWKGGSLTIR